MNLKLESQLNEQIEQIIGKTDLLKYIQFEQIDAFFVNSQIVKDMLLKNTPKEQLLYQQLEQETIKSIRLSKYKTTPQYQAVLEAIMVSLPKAASMIIWNSQLDKQFFVTLRSKKIPLQQLILRFCNVGQKITEFVQLLNLSKLRNLSLTSEKVNNRTSKQLLKIYMPAIKQFGFQNTDMTTDGIRTIGKLPHCLKYLFFIGHQKSITIKIIKQAAKLVKNQPFLLTVTPYSSEDDCIYISALAAKQQTSNNAVDTTYENYYLRYPINKRIVLPLLAQKVIKGVFQVIE